MDLKTIYQKCGEHSRVLGSLEELERITNYWATIQGSPNETSLLQAFLIYRAKALKAQSLQCMQALKKENV